MIHMLKMDIIKKRFKCLFNWKEIFKKIIGKPSDFQEYTWTLDGHSFFPTNLITEPIPL